MAKTITARSRDTKEAARLDLTGSENNSGGGYRRETTRPQVRFLRHLHIASCGDIEEEVASAKASAKNAYEVFNAL